MEALSMTVLLRLRVDARDAGPAAAERPFETGAPADASGTTDMDRSGPAADGSMGGWLPGAREADAGATSCGGWASLRTLAFEAGADTAAARLTARPPVEAVAITVTES